jgi:Tfp pilus assembly protein PilF
MEANSAEAYNLLGIAYQSKGLTQVARSSFEKALKIAKKDPQTLNNLGYLLYVMSDFPGALDYLKKAARLAPNDSRILNNLAMTQSQLGKFDDAAKNFVRAGGEIDGRLNTARRLEIAGRTEEALKNYEAARLRAEAENKANPGAESITVLMEIQNGRVTFASVPNHRPGMEAYEASALRLARQRRYPASKNGQESVVMRVSIIPA